MISVFNGNGFGFMTDIESVTPELVTNNGTNNAILILKRVIKTVIDE